MKIFAILIKAYKSIGIATVIDKGCERMKNESQWIITGVDHCEAVDQELPDLNICMGMRPKGHTLPKTSSNSSSLRSVPEYSLVPRAMRHMFSQSCPPLRTHCSRCDWRFMKSSHSPGGSLFAFRSSKS